MRGRAYDPVMGEAGSSWFRARLVLICVLALTAPAQASNPGRNGDIAFSHLASDDLTLDVDVLAVRPDGTGLRVMADGDPNGTI
jgi:hypothetical protein